MERWFPSWDFPQVNRHQDWVHCYRGSHCPSKHTQSPLHLWLRCSNTTWASLLQTLQSSVLSMLGYNSLTFTKVGVTGLFCLHEIETTQNSLRIPLDFISSFNWLSSLYADPDKNQILLLWQVEEQGMEPGSLRLDVALCKAQQHSHTKIPEHSNFLGSLAGCYLIPISLNDAHSLPFSPLLPSSPPGFKTGCSQGCTDDATVPCQAEDGLIIFLLTHYPVRPSDLCPHPQMAPLLFAVSVT